MKKTFTLAIFTLILTSSMIYAQIDQVSVGPNYTQQTYYDLSTGEYVQIGNENWDVAFSNIGFQDAGVFINESAALSGTPLRVYLAPITDWNEGITDVSIFDETAVIYNPEENWTDGAFNSIKDPTSPFDYGWGVYNPISHTIEGDKVFVIEKRNNKYIKFQIQSLASGEYTFRYANLDGSHEATATVSKAAAGDAPYIYFSFETEQEVQVPTDYDLVFQRYTTLLDDGYGELIPYNVTGVLLAPGTEAVMADGVNPETVEESDYSDQYSDLPTTIGHDWKSFDFSAGWVIDTDRAYFVKTNDGEVYKIVFYDFEGSSTGVTTLERTLVTTVSTTEVTLEEMGLSIYPNPTADVINVRGLNDKMLFQAYDNLGRLVVQKNVTSSNQVVDLSSLNPGPYHVVILTEGKHASATIIRSNNLY